MFGPPSSRLPSLCCSCLVVQKDGVEVREPDPPVPSCVIIMIIIIIIIKKACKSVVEFA